LDYEKESVVGGAKTALPVVTIEFDGHNARHDRTANTRASAEVQAKAEDSAGFSENEV
jgi:hypothetical protein